MGADVQDLIAKLQIQLGQQQQQNNPSLFGLQAAPDPNATAAILKKLQDQQYVAEQGNNQGEYGFLANAGRKDFARAGQNLGSLLGVGQPQQMDNSGVMAQRQAIQQGKTDLATGLAAPDADPTQIQIQVLSKLAQQGVPGAAEALEKANDNAIKLATSRAQAYKDTAQGNSAQDEISNRAQQRSMDQKKFDQSTAKDTWSTISETAATVVQKNGLGEVRVQQKQSASNAAAAAISPDAMQAMLNSYHTTGTVPQGLSRSPAAAGAFWDAEAQYQKQTGNDAGAVLAAKASAKANTDALVQTQKQLSQTTSYFETMDKNISAASALANKLNLSDQPTLNRAVAAYEKGTSDPDFAKYRVFFDSVANEYAKIKSGALGNAPVSDSARKEAQDILIPLMGASGVNAAFDAVKQEGQNRLGSLSSQRDVLSAKLGGRAPAAPATPAPQQTPVLNYNPKTGTFE